MRISLIIPSRQDSEYKSILLSNCIKSLSRQVDEVILITQEINNLAEKINCGLKIATGDFLIVCNDDLELVSGNVKDLCIENIVTSPKINNENRGFSAHFWCIPKEILKKIGFMYQGYEEAYFDDDEYLEMIKEKGFETKCIDSVNVNHPNGGTTLHNGSWQDRFKKNKLKFEKRWR